MDEKKMAMRHGKKAGPWLIFAFLSIAVACNGRPTSLPHVRIVYAVNDHHAALFVAASLPDHFRENGDLWLKEVEPRKEYLLVAKGRDTARISLKTAPGGDELVRALSQDQADLALGGFPCMIRAIDRGEPLHVAAPLMLGGTGLVVGEHVGASDWEGFVAAARRAEEPLRIGYKAEGAVQVMALERALRLAGIVASREAPVIGAKVVLKDLHGPENLIPSLQARVVDGFTVMQPLLAKAEDEGAGKLIAFIEDFDDAEGKGFYPCCAVGVRDSFSGNERDLAESLVTLLLRANRLVGERTEEAVPLVAPWVGVEETVEARSLPTIRFVTDFDGEWARGAVSLARSLTAKGSIKGAVAKEALQGRLGEAVYDRALFEAARRSL